ncbi:MAG: hypothetical protein KC609_21360 [Myxococcales bacterium]|nr:hypothetical protein [Myxococcales bacterium]
MARSKNHLRIAPSEPQSNRVSRLKAGVQSAKPAICTERALIWTEYHRRRENREKPAELTMAEALSEVLARKTIAIHSEELIVGNYSSKRVGGSIYPELHGIPMLEDLLRFGSRETNPLEISEREILQLLAIVPFWLPRFLALRAHRSPLDAARFVLGQLRGDEYLVNEVGGISHVAPDYQTLINRGCEGLIEEARARQQELPIDSQPWRFLEGVTIVLEGLARFGERYGELAEQLAADELDETRRRELETIAESCRQVPRRPARTFREALQSLIFAQIAINLESLDNSVCPGRMDQYLHPFYQRDLEARTLTKAEAKELIACFSIKMCEIVPVFSERITRFHGGMFNGQVVTVGGVDAQGEDAVNELSYLFLDVMDELRMRQPNYHARLHADAPTRYRMRLSGMLASGSNSPALYNDAVIIPTMLQNGYTLRDARNYTGVGCVEPVCQGKSFSSTDAALVNVPLLLELALNEGRRFGHWTRVGAKTPPVEAMRSIDDLEAAFEAQLEARIERLVTDLHAVERANRRLHPTPLTSALLDGCIASARCSTAGGATYNFSGVQCVGPSDTGDAFYAIEQLVFRHRELSMRDLVRLLERNIDDAAWLARMRNLPKFGNDVEEVDRYTQYVIERFADALARHRNTRGGPYTTGLYSVTSHQYFGEVTGALPNGRRRGEPFSSGIAPGNGMDRRGPTAVLNSMNRLDFSRAANGINFNLKFDLHDLRSPAGQHVLGSLVQTYFDRGGMQVQVNVVDPGMLIEARDHPERYPNLLVRISGYSAYFNDLTPQMKDELIRRSSMSLSALRT